VKKFILVPTQLLKTKISGLQRFVIETLLAHDYKNDGFVYPSQMEIAEIYVGGDVGAAKKLRASITRAIQDLIEAKLIAKARRGRLKGYQIAEWLLAAHSSRRPADPAPGKQRSLLLPIKGDETSPVDRPAGRPAKGDKTSPEGPRIGLKKSRACDEMSPGREVKNDSSCSTSSTESDAARGETVKNAIERLGRAARAGGPDLADPAVRKQVWEGRCFQRIMETHPVEQAGRLLELYVAGDPAGKAAFEKASREMGGAKRRQRSVSLRAAGDERRSPRMPAAIDQVIKRIIATKPAGRAWDILAVCASGTAAIAAARNPATRAHGKAAGTRPAASARTARRRRVRA
jgi:hypothetical protein